MTPTAEALWASLPFPALVLTLDGTICGINPSAELFLNTSEKVLLGKNLVDRLVSDTPLAAAIARVHAGQSSVFIKSVEISRSGHAAQSCELQIAPMEDSNDQILLLIRPSNPDNGLGQTLPARGAARVAIGMAEMLVHEIKNPLAGITGAAQLLAMGLAEEDQEMTDLIVAESRRIVALLDQVEQFGNLRPPNARAVNIHDILTRARTSAMLGFASGQEIGEDYDPSLPATFVDDDQIMQVILNLLKNAVEALGPAGGQMSIRTYFDQGFRRLRGDEVLASLPIQVEIIDNGPGLPPELANEIFEPFVSGRENGTGLGLALANKIISDHRAWIGVTSEPGHTVFRLSLPLVPAEHQTNETESA